ncbi:hypothetical protein NKG05_15155 [Oerskovia sp. M15]
MGNGMVGSRFAADLLVAAARDPRARSTSRSWATRCTSRTTVSS